MQGKEWHRWKMPERPRSKLARSENKEGTIRSQSARGTPKKEISNLLSELKEADTGEATC